MEPHLTYTQSHCHLSAIMNTFILYLLLSGDVYTKGTFPLNSTNCSSMVILLYNLSCNYPLKCPSVIWFPLFVCPGSFFLKTKTIQETSTSSFWHDRKTLVSPSFEFLETQFLWDFFIFTFDYLLAYILRNEKMKIFTSYERILL